MLAPQLAPENRLLNRAAAFAEILRCNCEADFTVIDVESGNVLIAAQETPGGDWLGCVELCREVARRGKPEVIAEESPIVVVAVPLLEAKQRTLIGIAPFLTQPMNRADDLLAATGALGLNLATAQRWAQGRAAWSVNQLLKLTALAAANATSEMRISQLKKEVEQVTTHLLASYEEISLLYRLTQNLKISRSSPDLAVMALDWLAAVLPAEGFAVRLKSEGSSNLATHGKDMLLSYGDWPVEEEEFEDFVECIGREAMHVPIVLNRRITSKPSWTFPLVHEVVSVPLTEGGTTFGWLLAVNHDEGGEFGTVEASLLGSVGAILGIHGSNIDLYRQQAEFLACVVRALTSAIDAKDPYTCGHSDRVARVSVRLAEELGCDAKTQNTIYLSGLLHDIGKIGIDDNVLRKPGKLTEAEYEHIKLHPELGYKILRDLKQLGQVLPVVLHHHESWDGTGYPHNLAGEEIPFLARIVAVADSFDAMSSDRPYRKGMPYDRLEDILRKGSGHQWDPQVVDAFLKVKEEILEIARKEREALTLDMQQWA
jgi:hypothetical protein